LKVALRLAIVIDDQPKTWLDIPAEALEAAGEEGKRQMILDSVTLLAIKTDEYFQALQQQIVAPPTPEIMVP
jgi:hypothetical protein